MWKAFGMDQSQRLFTGQKHKMPGGSPKERFYESDQHSLQRSKTSWFNVCRKSWTVKIRYAGLFPILGRKFVYDGLECFLRSINKWLPE